MVETRASQRVRCGIGCMFAQLSLMKGVKWRSVSIGCSNSSLNRTIEIGGSDGRGFAESGPMMVLVLCLLLGFFHSLGVREALVSTRSFVRMYMTTYGIRPLSKLRVFTYPANNRCVSSDT